MNAQKLSLSLLVVMAILPSLLVGQQTATSSAVVPRLVNFSGRAIDAMGKPVSGIAGATFSIYKDQYEGAPLWMETQNVQANAKGNYVAQLGATTPDGLPLELFTSGDARWLGVRVNGGEEQPRVLLMSVPYALKAADAQTLGGLPPSAFALAVPLEGTAAAAAGGIAASPAASAAPLATSDVTTTGGTLNALPLWTTATNVQSSAVTQTGTGAAAKIGIGTATPATTLDVAGAATVRGAMTLPATAAATATAGKNSQPENLVASAFNSTTSAAVNQTFQWRAEAAGNNTASPSGTLSLLFGAGASTPAETGLKIAQNGQISFAAGQTFPGGGGTITGVTAGADLTGGGSSGNVTLNLDTTKVPRLKAANTFTGNQTVNGNLTSTGVVTGSSYQIGSNLFAFGSYANGNSFFGFAGNSTSTGMENTASGVSALSSDTTGGGNTAHGYGTLEANSTGAENTAIGWGALATNTTASNNTATGFESLFANGIGILNTANGSGALHSNTTASYNTAVGAQALYSNTITNFNTAIGAQALYSNTTGAGNTASGYQALFKNNTDDNTAMGYQTLYSNTAGANNTALGATALYLNTQGGDNIAVGSAALFSNVTGVANTAVGYLALQHSDANFNTALGHHALQANTTGYSNTGTGVQALLSNDVGTENTADGNAALNYNTSGSNNTAVGSAALYENTTGSNNTCIGYQCDFYGADINNSTAIGAHASVSVSDALVLGSVAGIHGATSTTRVGIGTSAPTAILTVGRGLGHPVSDSWETYSSRRWKTNIQTLPNALAKVELLRGVSYDLKDSGKHEIGVIAEEVGAVVPELVSYEENGKDARGVDYSRLTALLIEAAKQQQREIQALRVELRQTRRSLRQVRAQLAASGSTLVARK